MRMMAGRAVQLVVGLVVWVLIGVWVQSFAITPDTPPELVAVAYQVWWGITALAGVVAVYDFIQGALSRCPQCRAPLFGRNVERNAIVCKACGYWRPIL